MWRLGNFAEKLSVSQRHESPYILSCPVQSGQLSPSQLTHRIHLGITSDPLHSVTVLSLYLSHLP